MNRKKNVMLPICPRRRTRSLKADDRVNPELVEYISASPPMVLRGAAADTPSPLSVEMAGAAPLPLLARPPVVPGRPPDEPRKRTPWPLSDMRLDKARGLFYDILRGSVASGRTARSLCVLGSPVAAAPAAANDVQLGLELRRQGLAYSPSHFAGRGSGT